MKQLGFVIAFIAMSVFGIMGAKAQTVVDGVYTGTLSNIKMNSNSYDDATGVEFELIDNGNGTGTLMGSIGPIGKMPGTIEVNMTVTISENGALSASANDPAGTLVLNTGGSMDISVSSFSGQVSGNTIHFVLNTYAFKAFGAEVFPASVTFDGNK